MTKLWGILKVIGWVAFFAAVSYGSLRVYIFVRAQMMETVTFSICPERLDVIEPDVTSTAGATWGRTPGPPSGAVDARVVGSGSAGRTMYILARNQLFRLTTAPNSMKLLSGQFADSLVLDVQVVPVSAEQDVILARTSRGLFVSDRDGDVWTDITPRRGIVRQFTALRRGSETLIAAITRTEVLRSGDSGRSWEVMEVDAEQDSPFWSLQLVTDGRNAMLFVVGKRGLLRGQWDDGARLAIVEEQDRPNINSLDSGVGPRGFNSVVFVNTIGSGWRFWDQLNPLGQSGSWRSRDLGTTWEQTSAPDTATSWYPWASTDMFDQKSGRWLSLRRNAADSFLLSTDGEQSWRHVTLAGGALSLQRLTVKEAGVPAAVGLTNDGRSAAHVDLARECWQEMPLRLPVATIHGLAAIPDGERSRLYAATDSEVFVSADEASTWNRVVTMPVGVAINVMLTSPTTGGGSEPVLFFATTAGVYTLPRGETTAIRIGLDGENVSVIAFSPSFDRDRTMYAGTSEGVYRSVDGGQSWDDSTEGIGKTPVNTLQVYAGTVYAATRRGGFVSNDGGATWTSLGAPLESRNVVAVAQHVNGGGQRSLLAATVGRLYRSTAGGKWEPVNTPGPVASRTVNTIFFAPTAGGRTAIYLGILGGGVVRSLDSGSTWMPMASAESGLSVTHLQMLRAAPAVLVGGTPDRGVWLYRESE